MKLRYIVCTIMLLCSTGFVYAVPQASLTVNSKSINPNEKVTVTLSSFSFDVNTTYIEWTVSGKPFLSAMGAQSIDVTTGDIGQVIPITAKATTAAGDTLTTSISLTPQGVDMVWECPESYVPPFYEGKALPGEGSTVRVTAIPNMSENGAQVAPENLSYAWFINGEALLPAGGLGKQSALITLDTLTSDNEIEVRVRSASGSIAEKTIVIHPHDVMPMLYLYDEILGLDRAHAIIRRLETIKDFTLSVEPYYLSNKGPYSNATNYIWLLDGLPVTPQGNTLLSLQPKENSAGTKELSISLNNTKKILQKASLNLEILFDTRQ